MIFSPDPKESLVKIQKSQFLCDRINRKYYGKRTIAKTNRSGSPYFKKSLFLSGPQAIHLGMDALGLGSL